LRNGINTFFTAPIAEIWRGFEKLLKKEIFKMENEISEMFLYKDLS